jgi:hypothetical protein
MFKLKNIERKRGAIQEGELVTGMNAIKLPEGTFLKVLGGGVSNVGDIIIRTKSMEKPFRNVLKSDSTRMEVGSYWGSSLSDYKFCILYGHMEQDFPDYWKVLQSEK